MNKSIFFTSVSLLTMPMFKFSLKVFEENFNLFLIPFSMTIIFLGFCFKKFRIKGTKRFVLVIIALAEEYAKILRYF